MFLSIGVLTGWVDFSFSVCVLLAVSFHFITINRETHACAELLELLFVFREDRV